jgi:hypothetical protein
MIKTAVYLQAGLKANYTMRYVDGTVYVIFEQSNGWLDWLNNLIFLPIRVKAFKGMSEQWREHFGFHIVYASIRDRLIDEVGMILSQIEAATWKRPGLCCTGWSHGGALAQKSAEDIGFSLGIKADVVTFGSPKPFYQDAVDKILSRVGTVTLYKRRGDWVTALPFASWGFKPLVPETEIGPDEYKTILAKIANIEKTHTGYGEESLYLGGKGK